jgi:hypothetical protein
MVVVGARQAAASTVQVQEREDQFFPFPCSVLPPSFVPLLSIVGKKYFDLGSFYLKLV